MNDVKATKYLTDFEAKQLIVEIGKRMYGRSMVAANDGNISIKVGKNAFWTTPTGVSKGFMTPGMLVKVNMNGDVLSSAGAYRPSSEIKMHLRVYQENDQVNAVVHAHPMAATSFAIAGYELNHAILPEAIVTLGAVPIAPYATPGTQSVPDSIAPYVKTHNACMLANHGVLTWGRDIYEAWYRMESIEHFSQMLLNLQIIGRVNELSCGQVSKLLDIRDSLGVTTGGAPPCSTQESNLHSFETFPLPGKTPDMSSVSLSNDDLQSLIEKISDTMIKQMKE